MPKPPGSDFGLHRAQRCTAPSIIISAYCAARVAAKVAAQTLGFVWLAIGVVILLGLVLTGRNPVLAGADQDEAVR